ncbi:hypothetical protein FB45DRAFT_930387, partial [Roridomyces roridus]
MYFLHVARLDALSILLSRGICQPIQLSSLKGTKPTTLLQVAPHSLDPMSTDTVVNANTAPPHRHRHRRLWYPLPYWSRVCSLQSVRDALVAPFPATGSLPNVIFHYCRYHTVLGV